jgi:hypothetical protein
VSSQFWRNGEPTPWAKTVYTCGDCWLLALAIHRITGGPIMVIDDGHHYVTQISNTRPDRYLDITGLQNRYRLLREWEAWSIVRASDDLMVKMCADANDGMEEWDGGNRRANEIAVRLIEKYL